MALSDREIWMELESGDLIIEPLDVTAIGPSSVDLRLDAVAYKFKKAPKGIKLRLRDVTANDLISYATEQVDFASDEVELGVDDLIIGYTLEKITIPRHLSARIEGRSGFARLGLSVHNTAPMI